MQQQAPRGRLQRQTPIVVMPPPPKPRRTFRLWLIWLPLAAFLGIHLVAAVAAAVGSFSWDGFLSQIGIVRKDRFSAIALMLCICLAIVALARLLNLRKRGD